MENKTSEKFCAIRGKHAWRLNDIRYQTSLTINRLQARPKILTRRVVFHRNIASAFFVMHNINKLKNASQTWNKSFAFNRVVVDPTPSHGNSIELKNFCALRL
jgi:hypothetical protein